MGIGACLFLMLGAVSCDDDEISPFSNDNYFEDFTASSLWDDWDMINDHLFDVNELTTSFFEVWDTSNNNMLDNTELTNASNDFGISMNDLEDED